MLDLYDRSRRTGTETGMRREELPGLVRQIDVVGAASAIISTDVADADIERVIDEQVAYFEAIGHELEWKVFSHDRPADLVERLRQRGFDIDETEAILGLDVASAPAVLFEPTPAVRRVVDPTQAPDRIRWEMVNTPDQVYVYVAEVDGTPVSHGWVRFPRASVFASLWGGATQPEYRGRGLYSQLVAARVQEVKQRGYRYVTVDARAMSRPILERRGFQVLTFATACTRAPSPR